MEGLCIKILNAPSLPLGWCVDTQESLLGGAGNHLYLGLGGVTQVCVCVHCIDL